MLPFTVVITPNPLVLKVLPELTCKVPSIVALSLPDIVRLTFVLKISTDPELIIKSVTGAPPIVRVAAAAAVNVRSAVPPMLSELSESVGTFVIVPATVRSIITSSPATGTVPPLQLAPSFHWPPPGSCQVFVAPNDKLKEERPKRIAKTEKAFKILFETDRSPDVDLLEVICIELIFKLRFQYHIKKLLPALNFFFKTDHRAILFPSSASLKTDRTPDYLLRLSIYH